MYTEKGLAEHTGFSVDTVRRWRRFEGLPFHRAGRSIRYDPSDFDSWWKARRVCN